MRPAKIQINLRFHTIWSKSSLPAWRRCEILGYQQSALRICAVWSESSLGAHAVLPELVSICKRKQQKWCNITLQVNNVVEPRGEKRVFRLIRRFIGASSLAEASPLPWGPTAHSGGGGGWGRGMVTSYIWHSTDVRAECPFSALPGIWIAPFFSTKSIWLTRFSWFICERPHFSDIPANEYIFFHSEICQGCLVFNEYCYICLTTSNKWVYKSKGSIWIGQHFGQLSIWMGPFFQKSGIWMG